MADRDQDETRREAEEWLERYADDTLRADPDASLDLTVILASAEMPERFKPYFAESIETTVELLLRFAERFGGGPTRAAVRAMDEADRKFVEKLFSRVKELTDEDED